MPSSKPSQRKAVGSLCAVLRALPHMPSEHHFYICLLRVSKQLERKRSSTQWHPRLPKRRPALPAFTAPRRGSSSKRKYLPVKLQAYVKRGLILGGSLRKGDILFVEAIVTVVIVNSSMWTTATISARVLNSCGLISSAGASARSSGKSRCRRRFLIMRSLSMLTCSVLGYVGNLQSTSS